MDFYIVIPAHNEEAFLSKTLDSLVSQSLLPKKIVVVNDSSTDGTQHIIDTYEAKFSFIKGVYHASEKTHAPGSKIIDAFYKGYEHLNENYDVLCKFDADLNFPENYLETLAQKFQTDPAVGMVSGFCYIKKSGRWVLENLTNKDHIRGALKTYRKSCFEAIGGLKNAMGWDTVDELLAQYYGWQVITIPSLRVKHLKPTGQVYTRKAKFKQGQAFYRMRYGFWLTTIASAKLAFQKKSIGYFFDCLKGYRIAKKENQQPIVSEEEGKFIRKLRWKNIRAKFGISS